MSQLLKSDPPFKNLSNNTEQRVCLFLSLVAVIGFESVVYNVDEDTGFVEVTIGVLEGELEETISVVFSTQDGTAIGLMLASM